MDIYEVIKQDHDKARRMIAELAETDESAAERRAELYPDLKNELMMHQHVEEAVFYSWLESQDDTRADALEAKNEHHIVDTLLEELDVMPKDTDEWTAKFGVLREMVEHHMEEEEEEFFDHAREVIDDSLARKMARQMQDKKAAGLSAMEHVNQAS